MPGLPVVDEQTAQSLRSADALLAFLEAAVPDSAFLPGPGMLLTDLTTLTEGEFGLCAWDMGVRKDGWDGGSPQYACPHARRQKRKASPQQRQEERRHRRRRQHQPPRRRRRAGEGEARRRRRWRRGRRRCRW